MNLPDFMQPHTVSVETLLGDGSRGQKYATPATVKGFLDDTRQLVRSSNGDEIISESQFYADLDQADRFTTDSRVTVNGRKTFVIRVSKHSNGGLPGVPELVQVALQ